MLAVKTCHRGLAPEPAFAFNFTFENDPTHEEFWALKDVNFDIQQGDRVGIIGRNGALRKSLKQSIRFQKSYDFY